MKCKDCCHYVGKHMTYISCELTRVCIKKGIKNVEEKCEYFNKDLSKEKICLNCEHFLGNTDYGLSYSNNYYKLTEAMNKSCENFVDKSTKV